MKPHRTPEERLARLLARTFSHHLAAKLPAGHPTIARAHDGRAWHEHFREHLARLLPVDRTDLWEELRTIASDRDPPSRAFAVLPAIEPLEFSERMAYLWTAMDGCERERMMAAFLTIANRAKARAAAAPRKMH